MISKMQFSAVPLLRAFALAVLAGSAFSVLAQTPAVKPDLEKGKAIAAKVCAACHGPDGNSPTPLNPKIAGQFPEYTTRQLVSFKANATRKNPVMMGMSAGLSDEDIRNISVFYAGQKPKEGAARNADTANLGRKVFRGGDTSKGLAACASCHGVAGAGIPSQYPRIAGQYAEYTEAQLRAFRSGERANDPSGMMRTVAGRMSDAEIKAVADYIAGLR